MDESYQDRVRRLTRERTRRCRHRKKGWIGHEGIKPHEAKVPPVCAEEETLDLDRLLKGGSEDAD